MIVAVVVQVIEETRASQVRLVQLAQQDVPVKPEHVDCKVLSV